MARRKTSKHSRAKTILRLADLEQPKNAPSERISADQYREVGLEESAESERPVPVWILLEARFWIVFGLPTNH